MFWLHALHKYLTKLLEFVMKTVCILLYYNTWPAIHQFCFPFIKAAVQAFITCRKDTKVFFCIMWFFIHCLYIYCIFCNFKPYDLCALTAFSCLCSIFVLAAYFWMILYSVKEYMYAEITITDKRNVSRVLIKKIVLVYLLQKSIVKYCNPL